MIYAIGTIGQRARIYVESSREAAATSQVGPGEVCVAVAERVVNGVMTATGIETEASDDD